VSPGSSPTGARPTLTGTDRFSSTPSTAPTNVPLGKDSGSNVPEASGAQVLLARQDLERRLGAPQTSIRVLSVEVVDWPDSALGCAEPGKMYAQVITPGYRIVLDASGNTYQYHSDKGTNVVLCTR
jgi:hypothetical protein